MKLSIYLSIFAALVVAVWGYGQYQYHAGQAECAAKVNEATVKSAMAARLEERTQQEAVNATLKTQINERDAINAGLTNDIIRLRNERDHRRNLSKTAKARCKGASGAELSGPDAEFLVRLAARADKLRSAYKSCLAYADTVTGQ